MNLLLELYDLFEKDTPGLALGAFKLNYDDQEILTNIGGKTYVFTLKDKNKNVAELFNSVTGIAKHSTGRALAYLKKYATGVKLEESLNEDLKDLTKYDNFEEFKDEVENISKTHFSKNLSMKEIPHTAILYHVKEKYFAAWDRKKHKGIIDPDFKGSGSDLLDLIKKIFESMSAGDYLNIEWGNCKAVDNKWYVRHLAKKIRCVAGPFDTKAQAEKELHKVARGLDDDYVVAKFSSAEHDFIKEDLADLKIYDDPKKFEADLGKDWELGMLHGINIYNSKGNYFAAWDKKKQKGIIDPDFEGSGKDLVDQLEKLIK